MKNYEIMSVQCAIEKKNFSFTMDVKGHPHSLPEVKEGS